MVAPRVLLIDNYDSFTHNLYQALCVVGPPGTLVRVVRNDAIDLAGVLAWAPTHLVLSPGPGRPEVPADFGICAAIIDTLAPTRRILGVCLGHQGLVWRLGGAVVRAPRVMHGKTDVLTHSGKGLFAGLPQPLSVMRYHSLVVDETRLPAALAVTARNAEGLVMAVAHRQWPVFGVQFHPESIGTPEGPALLANFLAL